MGFVQLGIGVCECIISRCTLDGPIEYLVTVSTSFNKLNKSISSFTVFYFTLVNILKQIYDACIVFCIMSIQPATSFPIN